MVEVDITNSASTWCNVSTVYINGKLEPRLRCSLIETSIGPMAGTAILSLGSTTNTEQAPRTLMSSADYERWKFGSRVKIMSDGVTIFLGTILKRTDDMSADRPMWIALDDRWVASRIKIRGAFVYDPSHGCKWISRIDPFFNPSGMWNCIGYDNGSGIVPVFAPYAQARPSDKTESFIADVAEGEISAWTPKRALQYLQMVATIDGPDGWVPDRHRRTLRNSTRIEFPVEALNIIGTKKSDDKDPLDSKLQSYNAMGANLVEAVCQVLKRAGTHELGLELSGDKSKVVFFPLEDDNKGVDILVRRGAKVAETSIAKDFNLIEDAEDVVESVLVEGQPHMVETRLEYDPEKSEAENTLIPNWTAQREEYFKMVIWGAAEGEEKGSYALIPSVDGGIPDTPCNGSGETTEIEACKVEAVALARQLYPDVYFDYLIKTENLDKLSDSIFNGLSKEFESRMKYPILFAVRPALQEQLSKFIVNGSPLNARLPVRIQIKSSDKWFDAPFLNGFAASTECIRIQGLSENADGQEYCNYEGSLLSTPWEVTARGVRINIALPCDHRVEGYAELGKDDVSQLDPSLNEEIEGKLLHSEINPAYVHEYRKNSYPTPTAEMAENGDIENSIDDAEKAAERLLVKKKKPEKRSSWSFAKIRLDYTPGKIVNKVRIIEGSTGDVDYDINSPIKSVVYDFDNNETKINGLIDYAERPMEAEQEEEPALESNPTESNPS